MARIFDGPLWPVYTDRLRLRKWRSKQMGSISFYKTIHI